MNTTLIITWTSVQCATKDMTVNIPSAIDTLKSLWADQAQTPVLHCVLTARTNKLLSGLKSENVVKHNFISSSNQANFIYALIIPLKTL